MNIWGVYRVCGTLIMLIMFNVLFASYALARFFVLREFVFSKKVSLFAFQFACGSFCVFCGKKKTVCMCCTVCPCEAPERLGLRVLGSGGYRGEKTTKSGMIEDHGLAPERSEPSAVGSGCWKPESVCAAER